MSYTPLFPPMKYEQARASTLTAHFTPPVVIKAMYKALSIWDLRRVTSWSRPAV